LLKSGRVRVCGRLSRRRAQHKRSLLRHRSGGIGRNKLLKAQVGDREMVNMISPLLPTPPYRQVHLHQNSVHTNRYGGLRGPGHAKCMKESAHRTYFRRNGVEAVQDTDREDTHILESSAFPHSAPQIHFQCDEKTRDQRMRPRLHQADSTASRMGAKECS
jgi:hypothetical protein